MWFVFHHDSARGKKEKQKQKMEMKYLVTNLLVLRKRNWEGSWGVTQREMVSRSIDKHIKLAMIAQQKMR